MSDLPSFQSCNDNISDDRAQSGSTDSSDNFRDECNRLIHYYRSVRKNSLTLAAPLSHEDWMLQSMPDASPIKWHLAHITWFFETFLLKPHLNAYKVFDPNFGFLFNSYYQQIGEMHARPQRGLLSRPTATQILNYRNYVDQKMEILLGNLTPERFPDIKALVNLGCAHEEQHQELMQTDILHALSQNAMLPAAYEAKTGMQDYPCHGGATQWISFEGGLVETGAKEICKDQNEKPEGGREFAFDNEYPSHQYYLNPFELASRPVTNREYLEFIEDGGYRDHRPWLSDGWAFVQREKWNAPLYWRYTDDEGWLQFTLFGERPLSLDAPVRHVSYYEAAAYASWAGVYLPTETEWEVAAASSSQEKDGHFLSEGTPSLWEKDINCKQGTSPRLSAMFGHVWEWTASPYTAYPGYKPAAGAIGEYNGKFMSSQMVLRGGSCATPQGHVRSTYRNFFPPHARWQFSGFRLAR